MVENNSTIYFDSDGRAYVISDGGVVRYLDPKPQKKGIISKIKNWWNGLSYNQQLGITCGVWALDGILWGSLITANVKDKQAEKLMDYAYDEGVRDGQMKMCQELAVKANQNQRKI